MKLVKHYLENIAGIEIYPIISFAIFFSLFLFILWYVVKMDNKVVEEVSKYVFDDNDDLAENIRS